jgi:uncharacterized protein YggE
MSDRTIEVSAIGRRSDDPDEALVRVSVVASAADTVTARQQLAKSVSGMRTALTEAGIAADRLRTDEYRIYKEEPPYEPGRTDDRPDDDQRTHTAVQTVTITTDPASVGEVIDTAVTNGADRVRDVRFTLSGETRDRLRTSALEDAMTAAREQAETIAAAADLTTDGVRSA